MPHLLPVPYLVALGILVVGVALGGALTQPRWPRAAGFLAAILVASFVALAATATALGWQKAGWLGERLVPHLAAAGLPLVSVLTALVVFRRARAPVRIALAIALGAAGISYAGVAGIATACLLTGDCL
ncbi:conserved hypothetical Na/H antiporter [Anaeromyxobacter dehalogenans 2CP-1]|uniref:Conserved hypothetical Na/H antiporter n=1 Tax=Anaeromyxobacter dehalogenans (strain ATCC BAA-258 / DSM 21875 / 2CP-1) TaxID=455488 RepID=B8JA35_ANAD2|nr:hypothetical protein [Anaeromyxobacter dehalogenans]ACL63738.1 conserved hypothetical Na/H antiporter [Anaeromyxobacter dehalogenans 2CP-1]